MDYEDIESLKRQVKNKFQAAIQENGQELYEQMVNLMAKYQIPSHFVDVLAQNLKNNFVILQSNMCSNVDRLVEQIDDFKDDSSFLDISFRNIQSQLEKMSASISSYGGHRFLIEEMNILGEQKMYFRHLYEVSMSEFKGALSDSYNNNQNLDENIPKFNDNEFLDNLDKTTTNNQDSYVEKIGNSDVDTINRALDDYANCSFDVAMGKPVDMGTFANKAIALDNALYSDSMKSIQQQCNALGYVPSVYTDITKDENGNIVLPRIKTGDEIEVEKNLILSKLEQSNLNAMEIYAMRDNISTLFYEYQKISSSCVKKDEQEHGLPGNVIF